MAFSGFGYLWDVNHRITDSDFKYGLVSLPSLLVMRTFQESVHLHSSLDWNNEWKKWEHENYKLNKLFTPVPFFKFLLPSC